MTAGDAAEEMRGTRAAGQETIRKAKKKICKKYLHRVLKYFTPEAPIQNHISLINN